LRGDRLRRRREQIGNDLAIILATDGGTEQGADEAGEIGVFFHMGEDGTADDDFASRVDLAIFALGFLLKRVEPLGERVFLGF